MKPHGTGGGFRGKRVTPRRGARGETRHTRGHTGGQTDTMRKEGRAGSRHAPAEQQPHDTWLLTHSAHIRKGGGVKRNDLPSATIVPNTEDPTRVLLNSTRARKKRVTTTGGATSWVISPPPRNNRRAPSIRTGTPRANRRSIYRRDGVSGHHAQAYK